MNSSLPIEAIRADFISAIATNHIVVESPTGSGKSTHLPLWCLARGKVLVIEPRRLACRSLARHVAGLYGCELGQAVGYAVRFDSQYSNKTQLVFATPGIALRWFADNRFADFATIILDEFHERRWDTDLLAALLENTLVSEGQGSADESLSPQTRVSKQQRIVITSATVEGERLATYLHAIRLQSEGRLYPVDIRYTENTSLPNLKHLDTRIVDAITEAVKNTDAGDILVFLPGKGEIQACLKALQGKTTLPVIPLHAGIDAKLQDHALALSSQRRIILSTNVAETSLTIPGVRVVIDSGLERRTHHRNARTVLGLHCISQAAADQRSGRAGRLAPGLCYRLWGRQARLEPYTAPEVEREDLTELYLASAAAGMPAPTLTFANPLPKHAMARAEALLYKMQAIDEHGLLTKHGKRLFPLPLDPLFAHLITAMPDADSRCTMIDLAAALSVDRQLLKPMTNEAQQRALNEWVPMACDASTLIALMRESPPEQIPVNPIAIKEARRIAQQTYTAMSQQPVKGKVFNRDTWLAAVVVAEPELVYVRRKKRRDALGNGYAEVEVGRESRFLEDAEAALVLDQHHSPGKGTSKTINRAICMAPLSFNLLHKLNLGDIEYADPRWDNGRVVAERQRVYAGRTIHIDEVEPTAGALRAALATLIVRGSLLRPAGETLRTDIEAWNLYLQLGLGEGEVIQAEPWLQQRLSELGVESSDDLQLIEVEDIRFRGIPDWERENFDAKYPRHVSLSDLYMDVQYFPRKKQIDLVRVRGRRKTPPKRLELPAWSGWSVRFRDASRVLVIK